MLAVEWEKRRRREERLRILGRNGNESAGSTLQNDARNKEDEKKRAGRISLEFLIRSNLNPPSSRGIVSELITPLKTRTVIEEMSRDVQRLPMHNACYLRDF